MMISIIVPAFNAAATLDRCLTSLLEQSFPRDSYEVIVVDDGSTDQTAAIAGRYEVQLIKQINRGPAAARNAGAAICAGEIILFTDADCVPSGEWIEEMYNPFRDDAVVAVKGAYRTEQKEIVARFAQLEFEERFAILERAGHTDMVDTYSAGYRKKVFMDLKGFDTSFPVANNEDTELSYRLAAKGLKMVFNPRAIVYHLGHPDTLRKYARLKFLRGYWRMVVYHRFPKKMVRDIYTPKTLKFQIATLFCLLLSLLITTFGGKPGSVVNIFFLAIYLGSLVPFFIHACKRDIPVAFLSPLLLSVRALSIGSGAAWGAAVTKWPFRGNPSGTNNRAGSNKGEGDAKRNR